MKPLLLILLSVLSFNTFSTSMYHCKGYLLDHLESKIEIEIYGEAVLLKNLHLIIWGSQVSNVEGSKDFYLAKRKSCIEAPEIKDFKLVEKVLKKNLEQKNLKSPDSESDHLHHDTSPKEVATLVDKKEENWSIAPSVYVENSELEDKKNDTKEKETPSFDDKTIKRMSPSEYIKIIIQGDTNE